MSAVSRERPRDRLDPIKHFDGFGGTRFFQPAPRSEGRQQPRGNLWVGRIERRDRLGDPRKSRAVAPGELGRVAEREASDQRAHPIRVGHGEGRVALQRARFAPACRPRGSGPGWRTTCRGRGVRRRSARRSPPARPPALSPGISARVPRAASRSVMLVASRGARAARAAPGSGIARGDQVEGGVAQRPAAGRGGVGAVGRAGGGREGRVEPFEARSQRPPELRPQRRTGPGGSRRDRRRRAGRRRPRPRSAGPGPGPRRPGRPEPRRRGTVRAPARRPRPGRRSGSRISRRATSCAACQRLNGSLSCARSRMRCASVSARSSRTGAEKSRSSDGTGSSATDSNTISASARSRT